MIGTMTSGTTSQGPGANPANRLLADWGLAAEGAGPAGPGAWPQPADVPAGKVLSALNPLQHLPVVGMIYRAATGDEIPPALKIAGSAVFGGPVGAFGSMLMSLVEELIRLGPDTSRPAAPAGMQATGSEAGVQPVTPGTAAPGTYLTLATVQPDFLPGPTMYADATAAASPSQPDAATQLRAAQAYKTAETEWQSCCRLEKGLT